LLKVLEIKKKHYGENHVDYAESLDNLSKFLKNIGEFEDAK
jgi:glutaredoxin-related protein